MWWCTVNTVLYCPVWGKKQNKMAQVLSYGGKNSSLYFQPLKGEEYSEGWIMHLHFLQQLSPQERMHKTQQCRTSQASNNISNPDLRSFTGNININIIRENCVLAVLAVLAAALKCVFEVRGNGHHVLVLSPSTAPIWGRGRTRRVLAQIHLTSVSLLRYLGQSCIFSSSVRCALTWRPKKNTPTLLNNFHYVFEIDWDFSNGF